MALPNIPQDARLINALFELCAGGVGSIFGNKSIYREPKAMLKSHHESGGRNSQASLSSADQLSALASCCGHGIPEVPGRIGGPDSNS